MTTAPSGHPKPIDRNASAELSPATATSVPDGGGDGEGPDSSSTRPTGKTASSNIGSWVFLIIAGIIEVGYAISVGGSEGFTRLGWSVSALIFFLFTLFFLSLALRKIDVGIGYAVWVGIGAVGAVIASAFFFDEPVTFTRVFWLSIIIAGVVWLKVADSPKLEKEGSSPGS